MRVFITGASGYIGEAVTRAFVRAGHEVAGLHHSPDSGSRVRDAGALPVRGDLADPSGWREAAAGHDVFVHAGFDYGSPVEADLAAIDALRQIALDAIDDTHLIYTSGCWVLGDTGEEPVDEKAPVDHPAETVAWRPAHEELVLGTAEETVAATVVRPGMVYGGSGGLVVGFFESAEERGAAEHVGDGTNRWSMVHRDDLGRLYVAIAESRAGGVFHGVDGTPVQVALAAREASRAAGAGGEVRSVPVEEARESMGAVADALALDQALVTARADEVGWRPDHESYVGSVDTAYAEWREGRGE